MHRRALTILAAAMALAAGSIANASITLRDDLGRNVSFERPPARIVTLAPVLTEIVCALDACDRLVAVDRFSDWPASVRTLPKAGGLDDTPIETVVRLAPDLVLVSRATRATPRLAQLGLRTFAVEGERFADIARMIALVGDVLGAPDRASALVRRLDAEVAAIATERRLARAPTVFFEIDGGPYAAGPDSYIGELLERLGARNIVPRSLGAFPRVNPELVVRANPDVLVVAGDALGTLATRPGWSALRAVREQRVCSFAPPARDAVMRPGPRVAEALRAIADCLARTAP